MRMHIKLMFLVLLIPSPLFAGRNINLPFALNFDSNNYSDLLWVINGTTHTWLSDGGWSGGAAKFTPPTIAQANHGLGQFTGLRDDNTTQINIRFLVYYGSAWREYMQGLKMIITNPVNQSRMMMFTDKPTDGNLAGQFVTYGACYQGNICKYDNDSYGGQWPQSEDRFRIGDRTAGFREGEWISVEYEANTVTGMSRVYIHTQDGLFNGIYTEIINPNSN
ncbi:MAG: hypothetical protein IH591_09565, partial [Bacteroidales bacterium]|nr:hypothetical protein [Bacteroidales bacterium]